MFDRHNMSTWHANRKAWINFLRAQLELAITYCQTAERSDLAHLPVHLRNARKSCDNILRYILRSDLGSKEFSDIASDAERLKCRLAALDKRMFRG
jgi:hypothetical protein